MDPTLENRQRALERAHPPFRILCLPRKRAGRIRGQTRAAAIVHGTDWTERYLWIAAAALKSHQKHFVVEGEEVVLGVDDDASDFNALHSRKHNSEAQLWAFVLAIDGDGPRDLPLYLRKTNLQRLLTPLGHVETQFLDRQEIGSCFRPFRDRSCLAFGHFYNPHASRAL
jgi:ATP-dependent DNA ligase